MTNQLLQTFLTNVTRLTHEYDQLKQYTCLLHDENKALKQSNNDLTIQNTDAKNALHQIIDQLKEIQA
tara:strand:- start:990 stop:1193 length:204 start_codon:yes stop_codon:yes gene_type:complete